MELDLAKKQGVVALTREYRKVYVWSLVLHAAGIEHVMLHEQEGWLLIVHPEAEEPARREISAFEEENRNWPPPHMVDAGPARHAQGPPPTLLLMAPLLLFYFITGSWYNGNRWFEAGAVSSTAILKNHEWWRVVTGLTLHADSVHVLGNVVIGGLLIHYLCDILGTGMGVSLVLLTGIIGNTLNVLLRGPGLMSVGFSTAVFGTVGLLSSLRFVRGGYRQIVAPLGAGLGLLALLGTEGERTDLGAHAWGLAAGLVFGFAVAHLGGRVYQRFVSGKMQLSLFIVSGVVILTSWWLALSF